MKSVKMKMKRTAIVALTLALMWMFLLPVQAFAEDGIGEGTDVGVPVQTIAEGDTGGEGGSGEAPSGEENKTEEPEDDEAAAATGSAYLAPDIEGIGEEEIPEGDTPEEIAAEGEIPEGGIPEEETPEGEIPEGSIPEEEPAEGDGTEVVNVENGDSGEGAMVDAAGEGEWIRFDNSTDINAIQQAVDAAIAAGQKYITVVVQDGTYSGGLTIDNSGVDEYGNAKESIIVNIIAHDAYEHSEDEGAIINSGTAAAEGEGDSEEPAPDAVYPVPTNSDGTVDTSAINTGSAGGVKLEGGVSVQNVELLLAGIYLTLKEQQEKQEGEKAEASDPGNVDVKVEDADTFTYYGTSQNDTVNITLTDVKNATIDSGSGDDVLDISTNVSSNVDLDITAGEDVLKDTFAGAESSDSSVTISSGGGNDKITVTENSNVTNDGNVVSVRKGHNNLTVDAGDGADTITLKGDSGLVDIKKNISEAIAKKVYGIVSMVEADGHGSAAVIKGGADDDLLNLDTSWDLGTLGQTEVDYQGGTGKNRLHLTGTLAPMENNVSGNLDANGSGHINLYSKNTVSRTKYSLVDTDLWFNKTVTELELTSSNALTIQMSGVDYLTDDLTGKKTVEVTFENGKVMADGKEVNFKAFTDYVFDPEEDNVALVSFSNESAKAVTGLLVKLIIKGQNLTVDENVTIYLPGATLMLESLNGAHEGGSILIAGQLEADSIMLKLASTDSLGVSFLEKDGASADDVNPSIMDVNTSAKVTIAATAKLIATRVVDILAKTIQGNGLLPDLSRFDMDKIDTYVEKIFGFKGLEMLKQAASINFISIKMASAFVDILGSITAGSVRVSANSKVDTTATNSALRDLGMPFALSVILGEAGIKVSGEKASITAGNDIYLDAQSDITVNTAALSGRLPFTVAVSVIDNESYVDVSGGTLRSTNGNIIAKAAGTVSMKTSATGSNVRPNNNAVEPSTDNQASNTTTQLEMGKSGGFFAISVLNQDVFSALRGAASAIAKGDITVNSTAKAGVVNNATSNPGEDGESMTLVELIKMLTGNKETPGDGGILGKIVDKLTNHFNGKKNQAQSKEEKEEAQKQKDKKTGAIGNFLDKLTGNGDDSNGDDVGSLVDKATTSANTGKKDSTSSVQLVGSLGVTYANNNNKAYIETTGNVNAGGKLSVLANGEIKVETLADGSPVKADDPAGGDKKSEPKDQHYAAHGHGAVKVDALTNGTILIDVSVGKDQNGICEVEENKNFPKGLENYDTFGFVVKASFGYALQKDEKGYYIVNDYKNVMDGSPKTEKIYVEFVGRDADGCNLYKSKGNGYKLNSGENLFKAEFVTKHSLTVENNAEQLGKVEFSNTQQDGKEMHYADHEEMVYVIVNTKSGVNFTTPVITYISDTYDKAQPFDALELIDKDGNVVKEKTGDVQEDGTTNYYYRFKMPNGKVTMVVNFTGDDMNIKLDLESTADRASDVWITSADSKPSGEAMDKDDVYKGSVGDKVKIVIQLANNTYLVKNSLMFAGKTPVYIKDITYDGENQYTCYVNIPAILKTEGDSAAGSDLKLTFKTTLDSKEAQGTVEDSSTSLGAGLAVDVTRYNNEAYIAKNTTVTAGSVEVKADTAELAASAVSKAGFVAGDLGVAGAITVHLVSANNESYVGGKVILDGGDLVVDSMIQNSNIVTKAEAAGEGADGEDTDRDSVGVGAGLAVGVTNLAVVSRILDSASISATEGKNIGNLNINAGHTGTESMMASAGASGGTSAVPVLAMNISGVSVLADSGRMLNDVLKMTGDAVINAANTITRTITADAAAVGAGVGVGGSFIIDILNDSANAKLGRGVKTDGNVTVSADSVSRLNATAKAGAKGSVSDNDGAGDSGGSGGDSGPSGEEPPPSDKSDDPDALPDDYYEGLDNLFGEGSPDNELDEDDDAESLAPLFKEGDADAFVDSNKESAQDLSSLVENNNGNVNSENVGDAFENRQKAETSEGSVQVAATMVLNIQNNVALAQIDEVNSIETGGTVKVTSRHDTDGVIMANASATNSTTGVGVAVAINTVTYSNIAQILTDKITAREIVVCASVYEAQAQETAKDFLEAVKEDLFGENGSIETFLNDILEASRNEDLYTFIRNYLADRNIKVDEDGENAIFQLICQWIGDLIAGRSPAFPSEEQTENLKNQVTPYAKEIFNKVKKEISEGKLKLQLFGKDGILNRVKKEIKDLNLMEKATSALVSYLAGKLGGNEEAEGVGPRISTSAVSGAGATNVGVAGSVAISVVSGTSNAYIAEAKNGNMNVTDKITVESKASQDVHTSAGASVDALGKVDKNKNATDTANSTEGGASNADAGKSVGVGAAIAMSFADLNSDAGIGKGWKITALDLLMNATAENNVETTSVSGTDPLVRTEEPTDKTDEELTKEEKEAKEKEEAEEKAAKAMDYAVDASVSVNLIQNKVKAYLAENSVITLGGNLNMVSSQSGETNTNASGYAMGNETAVGAAVAINLAFSDVLTQVLGNGSVAGTATLDSKTENQDDATALALAMGAEMERYVAKLRNSEKVIAFNKKKEEENKKDEKIENKTANKVSDQLKRASKVSDKEDEDKSDPSQPLSVQAIKSQNVKTESTNQTDAAQNTTVGSTVTDATDANTGNAVSGTLNEQAQEGQSIHVAASVGVNVTEHSAKTEIMGNLTVGGLKAEVENTGNFSTASSGAAISKATNSNCVGAAVAVSVNGNKAQIVIPNGIQIVITGTPEFSAEEEDSVLGNVALSTVLNQNSTGDALGRYGALAVSGSSSGKGGKVGLAGSIAVMVAKGTSAILLGNDVNITGTTNSDNTVNPVAGSVRIAASDKSKLSAAAMAATKSGGAAAGVGASFALLYGKNEVLAEAGNQFTVSADEFSMTATKQAVDITDFEPDSPMSDYLTVLEVDSEGNGGYKTDDADKYGMIVLQKNQNGSYSVFTNLEGADILTLIQLSSVLASVNYYASAAAGTVMERKGDTSNQKAAVAGAISMLFNDSVTRATIGNNAKITTSGAATVKASSETNTRLLGGALSSSAAKAGIGLNVATVKQNDKVYATVGNAPEIAARRFKVLADSVSDMLVITAAAVNASGTSVGGALNVVINDTGAKAEVGNNASVTTVLDTEIAAGTASNVTLGSVTVSISGSKDQGASVGAIVSVASNASKAEATLGDNATVTSGANITISAKNTEQVISVLAAVARSGNGGAGAGTVSVLTTDARTIAGVGNGAKLTAKKDVAVFADSEAKLIDLMLAAAASTDAPAVGATIMVNVFNRETGAYIGNNSMILSKNGNVLVHADSNESAIIVSIAGAAASQNAISGNIQVNVGNSKTYATIGDDANIKAWDSIGVTANQDSTVVAISPNVSYGSGSAAVGATVQTTILGSEVKAIIGENANLVAYAQPSATNGVQTANRETKRKGIILSALEKDLVVAGGVSASAGKNAVAGVVETLVNRTIVLAKMGANAVVHVGFQSGDSVDSAFGGNTPSEKEGELSADADAHSTLILFGGAFSATSSTGVGATVLTLVNAKSVDAQILLSKEIRSLVHGNVNVIANAEDLVALISVNFGVSNSTAANVGGNVLVFQNAVNANLTGNLHAGDVTVQADSVTDLINAVASVSGSLSGASVSGAALVTYFKGVTNASVGAQSSIDARDLNVLATSTANINSDGVGLTASVGSAAVSGLVNIIITSTETKAYIDYGTTVSANHISVLATDNYDLLAVAASLSGGSNGIGVTAVVTVAKNTVLAYIGDNAVIESAKLTVQAISNRNIRNYAGSVAAGATAGVGVTVMVAVIGGKLDQDSANGIAKGFKPEAFMSGIQSSVPNAAKGYLTELDLSADLDPDENKASDLHVGDQNGNYSGTNDYRNDDFDQEYNSGANPGENFSGNVTNTDGADLGLAKPEGEYRNVVNAYIGRGSSITVTGATVIEAKETLNVDIVTASAAIGGTAGVNVGVAVVVAYSNVLAEIRNGTVVNCADLTVRSASGGDGSIEDDKASEILNKAGIHAETEGSSIRAIAITIGIGGIAGVSPSVAVVNMASSAIARMDGVSGNAGIITVKADMLYPSVLAVTGAVGAGGTAGVSASVAVVTFHSNVYAGITADGRLQASQINVLSNVDNTAKSYAMSLAGGTVGVNGAVAVVTNRSTTNTIVGIGVYEISGDVTVKASVKTNAESYIVGVALGGVAVGLNAAVVNQHAIILTHILGDGASSLTASGNVNVSNDVAATAKSTLVAVSGGGVGVGGNVLLVFNNMEATAAIINMPFTVNGNVTVSAGMKADSEANLATATVGGVAVGISTSYVGLNAKNLAYVEIPQGVVASAASIRVYAGTAGNQNSFNSTASTVAGGGAGINVGLNAAVADINASNEAKILSKGSIVGGVDVQANSAAAAQAEIYFASAGGINVAAATAVSLLRIRQLAEADISAIDSFGVFNVNSDLNNGSAGIPSYAKLVTISGGMYNASANVAVAYSLSQSIARAILHSGTNGGSISVNSNGSADAKSETLNQSIGVFNGSVYVNVAYAKGQFQSILRILDQVSAYSATVQSIYTTNATANLTPSASKLNLSLADFNVNLAIAKAAANALVALEGGGKLVLRDNLLLKANSSNSTASANVDGATVNVSGFSFAVNVADSQMAVEQTVRVDHVTVESGGRIYIHSFADSLASTAQTGANGGKGISIVGGKSNSASANVSVVNQILLDYAKLTAESEAITRASSANLQVNAIAKALSFQLSGINAAVTTTEAKVNKFNTGVFMNNTSITGYRVQAIASAYGTYVNAQSSVPHFSGSLVGSDSILASAKILEKLTQVIVNSGTIRAIDSDAMLRAESNAEMTAGSAHGATSIGAISVKDYNFTIDVNKILTEVLFDGQMEAGTHVTMTAEDKITGSISMTDKTIGGFTGTSGVAKINVKDQTVYVKATGQITAGKDMLIEAKADQKLSAAVDTSSKDFIGHGYAQTDIILYRNAIVDIDGNLTSKWGNITIRAQQGTLDQNNKVIDLSLKMSIDTWYDDAAYPTGTGKLVSVAQVNVAEGSVIQVLSIFENSYGYTGDITIIARSAGVVLVDVYRYVDKLVGGNRAYSIADVSETVKTNIGGGEKTRILGREVEIRAISSMEVRSISYALGNTMFGNYYPNATVIFCVDLDTIIRSAEISAQNLLNIGAYMPYAYVLGHCISRKTWATSKNYPSVTIKGNIYGDVTLDNNTILRTKELKVKSFQPADGDNKVKIERLEESFLNSYNTSTIPIVFDSTSYEAKSNYRTKGWDTFSKDAHFLSGVYNPKNANENNMYYSGKLIWSEASLTGETNPSGKTEVYLGSNAIGAYVQIERDGTVTVLGAGGRDLVTKKEENGVILYHVDGSKLQGAGVAGTHMIQFDTKHNDYTLDQNASGGNLTVFNYSKYDVQLDNVGQPGATLDVNHTNENANLIFNGGGNFAQGSIFVNLAGGDLKLMNGAQLNAQNIVILDVGAMLDLSRDDGKVIITNSSYTGNDADASIDIRIAQALNVILQTSNSRYTIQNIHSGGDLTVEVVNTAGKKMTVLLGELLSGNNVTVTVPDTLETADTGKVNITGNAIVLNAGGNVGNASDYLRIDSSANKIGGVTVKASGGIYLKEVEGDLFITEIINEHSGNVAIWTENGSIYADPNLNGDYTDGLEKLNEFMIKYTETTLQWSHLGEKIEILLQYLSDLIRIQEALESRGEEVLGTVTKEIDILHGVTDVEEALALVIMNRFIIGGTDYNDPELGAALMNGALMNEQLTDAFNAEIDRIGDDFNIGGALGVCMHEWRNYYQQKQEYYNRVMESYADFQKNTVNISSVGDLNLHLQSSTGTANVSQEINSLTVSAGGKVTITTAEDTILKNVYLESKSVLKLDPIVATDVIDLYCMEGIYAADKSNQVLLEADKVVLWSLFGDLGTNAQALILNTNQLEGLGTNVYLENRKDLVVDLIISTGEMYMTVLGDLMGLQKEDAIINGIYGMGMNLQVSGDVGKKDMYINISPEGYLNIDALNLYMTADGNVLLGTIRVDGMAAIRAENGSILNVNQNSGIWCHSMDLYAYGKIGTDVDRVKVYRDGDAGSDEGEPVMRMLFRMNPARATLTANSYLYGENIEIIFLGDENEEPDNTGNGTDEIPMAGVGCNDDVQVVTNNTGIRITGSVGKDAVLTVSGISDHIDCVVCQLLSLLHEHSGQIFVNLELTGEYAGKLLVQIPVAGDLAEREGQEIVVLTCREGKVWAIRATVVDGFVTFFTEKLGSFLVFGDPAQLELAEEGTKILLDQQMLPFGGWL